MHTKLAQERRRTRSVGTTAYLVACVALLVGCTATDKRGGTQERKAAPQAAPAVQPPEVTKAEWKTTLSERLEALEADAENANQMHLVAFAYLKLDDATHAAEYWEKALAKDPAFAKARFNLADAYYRLGRRDEAVAAWKQVLESDDDRARRFHASSHYNIGTVLHNRGRLREAMAAYDRAVVLNENHYKALVNCGLACAELSIDDLAIERFERAIEIRPQGWHANYNLALTEAVLGRLDEAIRRCRVAAEGSDPGRPTSNLERARAFMTMAECAAFREDFETAAAYMDRARALDETNPRIQHRLLFFIREKQRAG